MSPSSDTSESPRPDTAGWEPRDPTLPPPPAPDHRPPTARPTRRGPARRLLTLLLKLLLLGVLLLAGALTAGYLLIDVPPANASARAQANVYLYRDGTPLARGGQVNRENVRLDRIPLPVRHAVLAAEDRDFHTSRAVDPKAMLRAAWNTLTGKGRQSGSTITQQYVKNYYLGQEQTLTRKAREFFIAIKLERAATKEEILQGYLNTSYFGRNAYGLQAAARAYYGKDVDRLGTAEGAYLAALLKAPSAYDVTTRPENRATAVARWHYVLDGMVKEGWLTRAERATARFPDPLPASAAGGALSGLSGQRGYLVKAVEQYLTGQGVLDREALALGGYRITTTLDRAKQDALVRAVEDRVIDRLDPENNPADRYVRVGAAAVEPTSGHVLALYGGVDYTRQYVNNATRRDYQVGSTFKPFVLTAALQHGARTQYGEPITPYTLYDGTNRRPVEGWNGSPYDPANEDDASYGEIPVGTATDLSVNAVYAQMAVDVGPARVRHTAVALGLPGSTPDLTASPSIALGPATASVLDMARAYATLAAHGKRGPYRLVAAVTKDGDAVALPRGDLKQVVGREAADTTTAVLRSVVESGTGTAARAAGRPAAGKTGTAEDDKAAWFAGYTPELATVVALMGQDPATGRQEPLYGALGLPRINGGGPPAEIWARFTRDALAGTAPRNFDLRLMPGVEPLPDAPPGPEAQDDWETPGEGRTIEAGAAAEPGTGTGTATEAGAAAAGPPGTAADPATAPTDGTPPGGDMTAGPGVAAGPPPAPTAHPGQ